MAANLATECLFEECIVCRKKPDSDWTLVDGQNGSYMMKLMEEYEGQTQIL